MTNKELIKNALRTLLTSRNYKFIVKNELEDEILHLYHAVYDRDSKKLNDRINKMREL